MSETRRVPGQGLITIIYERTGASMPCDVATCTGHGLAASAQSMVDRHRHHDVTWLPPLQVRDLADRFGWHLNAAQA